MIFHKMSSRTHHNYLYENHCGITDYFTVDGGYSEWSSFSECTVTCGGGTHERTRECTNPTPANGGRGCEGLGPDKETEECQAEACPPEQDQG